MPAEFSARVSGSFHGASAAFIRSICNDHRYIGYVSEHACIMLVLCLFGEYGFDRFVLMHQHHTDVIVTPGISGLKSFPTT